MPHHDIESHIQARIRLAIGAPGTGVTVWRNQVGTGWQGANPLGRRMATRPLRAADLPAARAALQPGDVILRHPRLLTAGLCPGSSDLICLQRLTITPEHVGQTVGRFAAIEVKVPGGEAEPDQRTFIDNVAQAGGVAGVARSVDEAWELLR
jgi:hypothetical protein